MILGREKTLDLLLELHKEGRLGHGYIFFGPEKTGKFTSALALARVLEGKEEEDETHILQEAKVVKPSETGTIGVDEARDIKEFVFHKPSLSERRVVIVDEAEKMTEEAQNALLKIAEEPPATSLIILISREPEMLYPTLRSRFQEIYFSETDIEKVEEWLKADKGFKVAEAKKFAELSGGKPGLAVDLAKNEEFRERLDTAMEYLELAPPGRSELVKKLAEDDLWNATRFLDDLSLVLATRFKKDENFGRAFHALMEMRGNFEYYNLNPKLQLEAFSQGLGKLEPK